MECVLLRHPVLLPRYKSVAPTRWSFSGVVSVAPPVANLTLKIGKCKQKGLRYVCLCSAAGLSAGNLFGESSHARKNNIGHESVGVSTNLGVNPEISFEGDDFVDNEDDPDHPSDGFSSVQTAVDAIRHGKVKHTI